AGLHVPVAARDGDLRLRLRALTRVRTLVSFHVEGQPAGEGAIPKAPWAFYDAALRTDEPLDAALGLRPMPMVRGPDAGVAQPVVWIGEIEASSPGGLSFTPGARAGMGAGPLASFAFALAVGSGAVAALAAATAAAGLVLHFAQVAPLALLLVLTRLAPLALAAGLLTRAALGHAPTVARAPPALSARA